MKNSNNKKMYKIKYYLSNPPTLIFYVVVLFLPYLSLLLKIFLYCSCVVSNEKWLKHTNILLLSLCSQNLSKQHTERNDYHPTFPIIVINIRKSYVFLWVQPRLTSSSTIKKITYIHTINIVNFMVNVRKSRCMLLISSLLMK